MDIRLVGREIIKESGRTTQTAGEFVAVKNENHSLSTTNLLGLKRGCRQSLRISVDNATSRLDVRFEENAVIRVPCL